MYLSTEYDLKIFQISRISDYKAIVIIVDKSLTNLLGIVICFCRRLQGDPFKFVH